MSKSSGRKLPTAYKFKHSIFAFPEVETNPFPLEVLSFYKNPLGMAVTPDSEGDSSRLVLNPMFGSDHPLFLRCIGQQPFFAPITFGGWHFVPANDLSDRLDEKELLDKGRWRLTRGVFEEKGQTWQPSKYLHFAKVQVAHTFPIDMLRYDRCMPLAREDGETIRQIAAHRNGGTIYVVQLGESAKPIWWHDRWQSFGGTKFETIDANDLPDDRKFE